MNDVEMMTWWWGHRSWWHRTGADPGFETGGAQGILELAPEIFLDNLGDFLKKLAQKGVDVRPLRPPLDPRL